MLGRFVQPDTIVPEPGNPQSLNRYAYVTNNPLRYTDPSGHWLETVWDIANILWDIYEVRREPSLVNIGALVVDVGAAILPVVPAGVGMVVRGGKAAKAAVEVASHADEVVDAAQALSRADEAADAVRVAGRLDEAVDAVSAARRLREVGLHADEAGELIKALAKASTHGDPASKYVLLGSFPEYTDLAKLEGMTYFDMPGDVWNTLSAAGDEFVEAVNMQFLEEAIASGKRFVVVLGEGKAPGKWLKKELQYLIERGYHLEDGVWIPGQ